MLWFYYFDYNAFEVSNWLVRNNMQKIEMFLEWANNSETVHVIMQTKKNVKRSKMFLA